MNLATNNPSILPLVLTCMDELQPALDAIEQSSDQLVDLDLLDQTEARSELCNALLVTEFLKIARQLRPRLEARSYLVADYLSPVLERKVSDLWMMAASPARVGAKLRSYVRSLEAYLEHEALGHEDQLMAIEAELTEEQDELIESARAKIVKGTTTDPEAEGWLELEEFCLRIIWLMS